MVDKAQDRSVGDLLAELSRETGTLVRKEVQLATTEITAKAKKAAGDVGVIAGGGALAHAGVLVLLAALVMGLSNLSVAQWLAALIVGVATIVVGYQQVNRGSANGQRIR